MHPPVVMVTVIGDNDEHLWGYTASGFCVAAMADRFRQLKLAHINLHFIAKAQEASCNKTPAAYSTFYKSSGVC